MGEIAPITGGVGYSAGDQHSYALYKLPVLGNDSDPDGDSLVITRIYNIVGLPNGAILKVSDDGQTVNLLSTADGNRINQTVTFKYEVTDGHGGYDTATVRIFIDDQTSPLVLDLDHDGVELTHVSHGVQFDINNDGTLDHVGWASPDDGLLALDANHDGIINNQSELFGNSSQFDDGFANLASYDQNGDGIIDAQDEVYNDLLVWQDANSDGISQAEEMFHLNDLDIASINLNATETDYDINGNTVTDTSTFTYTDGTTGQIVDAWFETISGEDNVFTAQDGIADTFVFEAGDNQSEMVQNFNADEGDVLDISSLLDNFDPLQDAIDDFVFATTTDDGSTVLSVDATGSGNAAAATQFAVLDGVTTTVDDLSLKGALVTA